ncbi:MAG: hypothetical protein LUP93_00570 [Methanomicrobiales archaeon]|nr:hypothetical protein [Methanomicrobiales archaeon]
MAESSDSSCAGAGGGDGEAAGIPTGKGSFSSMADGSGGFATGGAASGGLTTGGIGSGTFSSFRGRGRGDGAVSASFPTPENLRKRFDRRPPPFSAPPVTAAAAR